MNEMATSKFLHRDTSIKYPNLLLLILVFGSIILVGIFNLLLSLLTLDPVIHYFEKILNNN